MRQLALISLVLGLAGLSAPDAFGWGSVHGPYGGSAYRGPMGRTAVGGPRGVGREALVLGQPLAPERLAQAAEHRVVADRDGELAIARGEGLVGRDRGVAVAAS